MNDSEKFVYEYLTSHALGKVIYEPDGKVPPDLLVDGRIAVEVRRLNQNEETDTGYRGLEEVSRPLIAVVGKALAAMGPPGDTGSWFVHYSFSRPLPPWKELEKQLEVALRTFRDQPSLQTEATSGTRTFSLSFIRSKKRHPNLFLLGGYSDDDEGGFVVSEMERNLRICIAEKSRKVARVRSKYPEWWLAFDDRIGYASLAASDRDRLRALIQPEEPWSKIILVNPLDPHRGFEL